MKKLFFISILFFFIIISYGRSFAVSSPNIIFITVDTLRADRLGCYGYTGSKTPSIDGLSKDGTLFSRAFTSAPITAPSIASLFSGLYPRNHKLLNNGGRWKTKPKLLAEIIKKKGYSTAGFVSVVLLDKNSGLDRGFDTYGDEFHKSNNMLSKENIPADQPGLPGYGKNKTAKPSNWISKKIKKAQLRQKIGEETITSSISWLDQNRKKPFFLWVHLYDPHWPYNPPERFVKKEHKKDKKIWERMNLLTKMLGKSIGRKGPSLYPSYLELVNSLYDGEVAYVDEQIGRLLSYLKKNNLYNDSVIVINSDHGEMLGEKPHHYGHHLYLYNSSLRVPLIMKFPGIAPVKIDNLVRTIDIMPTLLAYLQIKIEKGMDGISLLPLMKAKQVDDSAFIYIETSIKTMLAKNTRRKRPRGRYGHQLGIMNNKWKYFYTEGSEISGEFLFNLEKDPNEDNNLLNEHPEEVKKLKNLLNKYEAISVEREKPQERSRAQKERLQQLKSLGYL